MSHQTFTHPITNELWAARSVESTKKDHEKAHGVHIDVHNVSYSVNIGKDVKNLLKNVSFSLEPGSLCALMGPSGAGKSTLLDLLANRKLSGNWSGDLLFNKLERSKWFNRETAYVLQDDVHISTLTVQETIYYSAWVRLPEGTPNGNLDTRVSLLMEMMGLSHIKDNIVGDAMHKGISGGQLKRLSIAVEIVSMPNLIFLDEPTSGLDSSIALEVMTVVRRLADQGRTCVSTIHQPSPEVFHLFDKVILLSEGVLIYAGAAEHVGDYFSTLGYTLPAHRNPAEFIIDVSDGQISTKGNEIPLTAEDLCKRWKSAPENTSGKVDHSIMQNRGSIKVESSPDQFARLHATTKSTQFKMLMHRSWLSSIRNTEEHVAQLVKNFVVGFLIGAVFYGQAHATEPLFENGVPTASVTNVSSLLFFAMMYTLLSNVQAIPYLCSRNVLYRRELAAFSYSAAPYWLSQCLVILPVLFWNQLLFNLITFWLCAFTNTADYFFYFFFITYLTNISSFYFAMLLAGSLGEEKLAFAAFPIAFLFLSTFAGYSIQVNDIPPFWHWAPYVNYARWTFQGLMVNQWSQFDTDDTTYAVDGNGDVLALYDFQDFDKNWSYWILLVNILAIALCTYIAMRPPVNKLQKVKDALDMPKNSAKPVEVVDCLSPTLKVSLLASSSGSDRDHFNLESAKSFKNVSYDVQWYRQNTGEIPESRGCRLMFKDLHYTVPNKADSKSKLTLLKGVSGRAQPGEMVALMGASGAGKSTLLDILAGRKTTGEIKGSILFNGVERTAKIMRSSAYVMQDNVHIGELTVYQSLFYAAELRLNEKLSKEVKKDRVDKILSMLGLDHVKDTIVGTEFIRGISGGQLKRLSIGVEIINLPDLIFLDEPTTGLDSAISHEVMSAVRNLANQNRTVICTIHQPSPNTYLLFDKLLLLAEGRVIYFGPARDVVNYFTGSPYQFYYKIGSNPADYVIAVGGGFLPAESGLIISAGELSAYYLSSTLCRVFVDNIDMMIAMDTVAGQSTGKSVDVCLQKELKSQSYFEYNTSTYHQIKVLTHRRVMKMYKTYAVVIATTMRHVVIGIFYGTIYYQMAGGTDPTAYNNRLGLFFFSLIFVLVGHQQIIPEMQEERLLFYRERSAKAYGAVSYAISQLIVLIPFNFLNVFLYSVLVYYLSGLRDNSDSFGYFYYTMLITNFIGLFICQIISNIAGSTQAAMSFFPISLFFTTAFAGFIVYLPEFPEWLVWGPYLTFFRFAFQGLTLNEFQDNSDLPDEQSYIHTLGFQHLTKEQCAPILLIFMGFYFLMTFVTLKYINFEQR